MSGTLDFAKLTKKSGDLFELVVAASKRARQINDLRNAQNPLPVLGEDQEESFEETPDEEELEDWDEMEKPVTLAVDEVMEGAIDYRYTSPIEEPEPEEGLIEFEEQ
jgi:DNA-directed RNA polymerase omega subunit